MLVLLQDVVWLHRKGRLEVLVLTIAHTAKMSNYLAIIIMRMRTNECRCFHRHVLLYKVYIKEGLRNYCARQDLVGDDCHASRYSSGFVTTLSWRTRRIPSPIRVQTCSLSARIVILMFPSSYYSFYIYIEHDKIMMILSQS